MAIPPISTILTTTSHFNSFKTFFINPPMKAPIIISIVSDCEIDFATSVEVSGLSVTSGSFEKTFFNIDGSSEGATPNQYSIEE
jgi:hypothetical protein